VLHTDARFMETVEAAVGEIEAETDAEVVVVAARRSAAYPEVAWAIGAGAAWLALLFVLYSPFHFSGRWLPLELPAVGLLAGWLGGRSWHLIRLCTRASRRRAAVDRAAHAAFHEEVVHGTARRTGLLIYVSALEDRVVLLADGGIEAHVPGGELHAVRWGDGHDPASPGDLDHFVAGLRQVGAVLAAHVPPVEGGNPNEIGDAPRIRS